MQLNKVDKYTNIDERYGNEEPITLQDYKNVNPTGEFIIELDGIYELTENETWLLIASKDE